jgi:dUTPase
MYRRGRVPVEEGVRIVIPHDITALVGDRCRLAGAQKAALRILDVSGIIQGQ